MNDENDRIHDEAHQAAEQYNLAPHCMGSIFGSKVTPRLPQNKIQSVQDCGTQTKMITDDEKYEEDFYWHQHSYKVKQWFKCS